MSRTLVALLLLALAAQAARHEQAKQSGGLPAFDLNYAPGAGAQGGIEWAHGNDSTAADSSSWDTSYSPYAARPVKDAKNFSDFLVRGFDSLGSSLFGKAKDKR